MEFDLSKLSDAGPLGLVVAAFLWLLWKVGNRIVLALDRLIEKLDEHTKTDVAHHAAVREEMVALSTRIDTALDITPIRSNRPKTDPHGVPTGYYAPHRPGTKGDR